MIKQLALFRGGHLRAQLLRAAAGTAVLKVANVGLTMLIGILLARMLGPDSYGVYAFVLSGIALLGLPTKAGLPTLIVRETAKNQLSKDWGLLRGLLLLANTYVIAFSLFVAAVAATVVWVVGSDLGPSGDAFLWSLLLLPLVAFANIRGATLRGLRKIVQGQLPEQVVRPVLMATFLLLALSLGVRLDAVRAIQFNVVAVTLAFIVGAVLLVRSLPRPIYDAAPSYTVKRWTASLVPLTAFSGLKLVDSQLLIVLLGFLSVPAEVGYFRVAMQGAVLVSFGLVSVNMVLAPHVARLYKAGEIAKLQRLLTRSTQFITLIALLPCVAFIFWADGIIGLVFGSSYQPAATALAILSAGQLINVTFGSPGLVLSMADQERAALKAMMVTFVVTIVTSVPLILMLGVDGAALSAAVSIFVQKVSMAHLVYKHLGLITLVRFSWK